MKNSYNLLISCGTLGSGGAERVISILSPYFADKFKSVTLVLWKKGKDFYGIDKRINVIHIPEACGTDNDITKMRWFRNHVATNKPDIILSFLYPYSLRIILSTIGLKTKIIAAERRDPREVRGGRIVRLLRDAVYMMASRVFVQSNFNKSLYPSFIRNKIDVLYNPIQINEEYVKTTTEREKQNKIVTVGRLIPLKNHKLLIDGFYLFHQTHPDYRLIIWGNGELRDELMEYAKTKGLILDKSIFFPGVCHDVLHEIHDASAFVLTSKSEGMPNALYEALCIGVPCISTKVTGVVDLLKDRENALLVDEDELEVKEALETIVDDQSLAHTISHGGKALYKILTPHTIANEWITTIEKVCRDET